MATENELRELCERIGNLSGRDQTRLLEMVLAENRRQYEETVAEMVAADAKFRELEKQRRAATTQTTVPPEAKREAG